MEPFSSVDTFLKTVKAAKQPDRQRLEEVLAPTIQDPSTFCIPPDLLPAVDGLLKDYGDEALKNIAMYCLGRWHEIHQERLSENCAMGNTDSALWTMSDLTKLSMVLQTLTDIGSFGGSDQWKQMITKELGAALMESLEEEGDLEEFLERNKQAGLDHD